MDVGEGTSLFLFPFTVGWSQAHRKKKKGWSRRRLNGLGTQSPTERDYQVLIKQSFEMDEGRRKREESARLSVLIELPRPPAVALQRRSPLLSLLLLHSRRCRRLEAPPPFAGAGEGPILPGASHFRFLLPQLILATASDLSCPP